MATEQGKPRGPAFRGPVMLTVMFKVETMFIFKERVLKDSIEINAPVEKVWEFFDHLDVNYKSWHEDSHVTCRWLKGKPHEEGSIAYFEEILDGILCKIKAITTKVEKYRLVETKSPFPVSLTDLRQYPK
jgi:hypothetical protein